MSDETKIPFGVHLDMSASVYHALPGASASILRKFHNSTPAHAKVEIEKPREPNVAMILGTLAHHHLLEPDKICPKVAIHPESYPAPANSSLVKTKKVAVGDAIDWSWRSNFCKDWKAEQERDGKIVLSRDEYADALAMVKSILLHPIASQYFLEGQAEVSLVSKSKEHDLVVRARLDWVPSGQHKRTILDLKTTNDSSERGFRKLAHDKGYHMQISWYADLWNSMCGADDPRDEFVIVAVESSAPYAVNVFKCSPAFIAKGRSDYLKCLATYVECLRTNRWPAYSEEMKTLELPDWVKG